MNFDNNVHLRRICCSKNNSGQFELEIEFIYSLTGSYLVNLTIDESKTLEFIEQKLNSYKLPPPVQIASLEITKSFFECRNWQMTQIYWEKYIFTNLIREFNLVQRVELQDALNVIREQWVRDVMES